ncbi:hypothetical protein BJY24_006302 [Nocardia transvalensis]|uniref:PucR-like helix-turn-helix protein n=1 Tax=Nocardia transvalensis TaxID=37333 RepID=A0A7W9PJR0_9NOCA|nr:helix-turn-helix domain-containing protein [Nocardia transvalensis]MBB5917390.1 hypothetical protein [Nocardia transvalensis]
MSGKSPNPIDRTVTGRVFTSPLRDVWSVSRTMVSRFAEEVATCRTLPAEALRGDVSVVTRLCLQLALSMYDDDTVPETLPRLEEVAAQWAREGIPLDIIEQAVHEGFRIGADLVHARATPAEFESVRDHARRQLDVLELITVTLTRAYIRELRSVVSEHHTAVHTLTSALLSGHADAAMARHGGIGVADRYHVVAVAISPHPEQRAPGVDADVVARRTLRRAQSHLATECGGTALSLLSVTGGTMLIPEQSMTDGELDRLIESMSAAAQVPIVAAVLTAATDDIPHIARQVHELLDTAQNLGCRSGLYRTADVALEYQITRPGPGREQLRAVLDPLDDHPELLRTLRCHLDNNLDRQRTARMLHIHTNTVDYRLKRIAHLTGYDPTRADDLWCLISALVVRGYART